MEILYWAVLKSPQVRHSGKIEAFSAYLFSESLVCFSLYFHFSFSITKANFLLLEKLPFCTEDKSCTCCQKYGGEAIPLALLQQALKHSARVPLVTISQHWACTFLFTIPISWEKVIFEKQLLNSLTSSFVVVFIHVYWWLPITVAIESHICVHDYHGKNPQIISLKKKINEHLISENSHSGNAKLKPPIVTYMHVAWQASRQAESARDFQNAGNSCPSNAEQLLDKTSLKIDF